MTVTNVVYNTTDFYLACYLKCIGYSLVDVLLNGKKSVFVFIDQSDRKDAVLDFYNNAGQVVPRKLIASIQDMKAVLHNL